MALISGGGSGHEPLHGGLVGSRHAGRRLPRPGVHLADARPDDGSGSEASNTGAGCLFIVKNYEGDVMNFDMAAEMSEGVVQVVTNDDVAVEDSPTRPAGAASPARWWWRRSSAQRPRKAWPRGNSRNSATASIGATRSMGVALTCCTVPAAGKPTFEIGDGEMEFGVGIHGEPGRRRGALKGADEIAEEICTAIVDDLRAAAKGSALLFVNGFGATPSMELYLMYNSARKILEKQGVKIARSLVGSYVTSLDMAGCSITLTMLDDQTARLWDAPVQTAALRWGI